MGIALIGRDQIVKVMFRIEPVADSDDQIGSMPAGRDGELGGSSPAAMRSVQSASAAKCPQSGVNSRPNVLTVLVPPGPDCRRRAQAAIAESKWPNAAGMLRVATQTPASRPDELLTTPAMSSPVTAEWIVGSCSRGLSCLRNDGLCRAACQHREHYSSQNAAISRHAALYFCVARKATISAPSLSRAPWNTAILLPGIAAPGAAMNEPTPDSLQVHVASDLNAGE